MPLPLAGWLTLHEATPLGMDYEPIRFSTSRNQMTSQKYIRLKKSEKQLFLFPKV